MWRPFVCKLHLEFSSIAQLTLGKKANKHISSYVNYFFSNCHKLTYTITAVFNISCPVVSGYDNRPTCQCSDSTDFHQILYLQNIIVVAVARGQCSSQKQGHLMTRTAQSMLPLSESEEEKWKCEFFLEKIERQAGYFINPCGKLGTTSVVLLA